MAPDGTRWHPDGAQMAPRAAPVARVDGSLCTGSVTATGRDVPLYRLQEVSWGRARKRGPPKKKISMVSGGSEGHQKQAFFENGPEYWRMNANGAKYDGYLG